MLNHKDYYEILQVHHLAEAEVIEGAYRRLSKKYHPDVNKNIEAERVMRTINMAYGVLSDPKKRADYDRKRIIASRSSASKTSEKNIRENTISLVSARTILENYFKNIQANNFEEAYKLLSNGDKNNISMEDYIYWQSSVAKIFDLQDFELRISATDNFKRIDNRTYKKIVEFTVDAKEYNIVMEMAEQSSFSKLVVLEDDSWGVYLGYENLEPLINKFQDLTELLTGKSVIKELTESYSRIDTGTGFSNQRGIIEKIENEVLRYERYGNPFSLLIIKIKIESQDKTFSNIKAQALDTIVKDMANFLKEDLRKLDIVGRWDEDTFLIILPETRGGGASKVIRRFKKSLKDLISSYKNPDWKAIVELNRTEYKKSLEETLDRIKIL